jgi:hypothetical protein
MIVLYRKLKEYQEVNKMRNYEEYNGHEYKTYLRPVCHNADKELIKNLAHGIKTCADRIQS